MPIATRPARHSSRPPAARAPRRAARARTLVPLAVLLALAVPTPAEAQYFGRNKVQYDDFDWRILHTPHFDVYGYEGMDTVAIDAGRMAERWYVRLAGLLDHTFDRRSLIFYADHPDFQQTNVIGSILTEGTGGVTEGLRTRVIMPFTNTYEENDHVLGHELVHVFQYGLAEKAGGLNRLGALPLWLVEGMAEYLSLGRSDALTAMWMRDAALRDDLPTIRQLTEDPRYFPYRYGQALWAYVAGRWGDDAVRRVYVESLRRGGFEPALQAVLGLDEKQLSEAWRQQIRADYLPLVQGRVHPDSSGTPVLVQSRRTGEYNLSPVQSPDGRWVAFFSRRGIFSVDLYVADARTGTVKRRLTSPVGSPHFDAISFIYSAAAWSPDGSRIAHVVYADGDNEVRITELESGDEERQFKVPGAEAISTLSWSPDGRRLVVAGMQGGLSDLWLHDLETGQSRRLTNDRYAELQPEWSPDGRTIAFATDRRDETRFDALTFGEMRLALLDPESGAVRPLPAIAGAKMINPQWSPDGQDLYYITDRGGWNDIYRLRIATGEHFQVTSVATGVSGISRLSPAISVARGTGRLLFSVFTKQGYSVYGLEAPEAQGTPMPPQYAVELASAPAAAVLPPVRASQSSAISAYLSEPLAGLPPADLASAGFEWRRYRPRLALDAIGQPSLGVSTGGPFGTQVGGGVSFIFGDQLTDQQLGVGVQLQGDIKDFGGQVMYLNSGQRINYALGAGRLPYITGGLVRDFPEVQEGVTGTRYRQVIQRIYIDQLQGATQYPFSATRRAELNLSLQRVSYDTEVFEQVFVGNQLYSQDQYDIGNPPSFSYGMGSAALVGDNSFFGFTSPVQGSRWRYEAGGTFGEARFGTLLADYRRYMFMRPVTLAWRGLHFGRYLGDADDPTKLRPIYVGDPSLVRGYQAESFEIGECTDDGGTGVCPEYNRLFGSRVAVLNAELRIPLFGTREFGIFPTSFLPIEIAPFVDAGVAWSGEESADLRFARNSTDRVPVFATGVSARANLFGALILEAFYAYPFQRNTGWVGGFQLAPGW